MVGLVTSKRCICCRWRWPTPADWANMGREMSRFLNGLHSGRVLLMDGAMGTQLQRLGMGPDECGEAWNVKRARSVRAVHDAYVAAGAEVLLTNTFQANLSHLAHFGLEDRLEEIISNA